MDNRIYFGQVKKENVKQNKQQQQQQQNDKDEEENNNEEFLPFSKHTQRSQEKHQKVLDEFERKKRAKSVIVPTIDNLVKLKLRELFEPIILFGEKPEDRRSRLRNLLIERNIQDGTPLIVQSKVEEEEEEEDQENFLTEGTEELKEARINIAIYSLKKSQKRLLDSKRKREIELSIQLENENLKKKHIEDQIKRQQASLNGGEDQMMIDNENEQDQHQILINSKIKTEFEKELEYSIKELKNYYSSTSQIGDDRPLSMGVFSPDGNTVAIGSWSGQSKVWDVKGQQKQTLTGHSQRVSCVAFHPQSTIGNNHSSSIVNIATSSADSTCKLWSLESSTPLLSLDGHSDVVNRCAFHPNGRYITTTSSDKSWRLWDIEKGGVCLLDQEGHTGPVMGVSIQDDGALLATGAQDGLVRIWDLRSGRPILYFQGHSKQVISVDWSPNSYHVASSSEDNSVIIWDIRKKEQKFHILAHNSIVPCAKFQKYNSNGVYGSGIGYLATCAFDGKIKVWSPKNWSLITSFDGHSSKVTSIDLSSSKLLSTSFDKTWKIWSNDN